MHKIWRNMSPDAAASGGSVDKLDAPTGGSTGTGLEDGPSDFKDPEPAGKPEDKNDADDPTKDPLLKGAEPDKKDADKPEGDGDGTDGDGTGGEDGDFNPFVEAAKITGLELDLSDLDDSPESIVKFANKIKEVEIPKALEEDRQKFAQENPEAIELALWKKANPGVDPIRYHEEKLGRAASTTKLAPENVDAVKAFLKQRHLDRGLSEERANHLVKRSVDAEELYVDYEAEYEITQREEAARQAKLAQDAEAREAARIKEIEDNANRVADLIRKGNVKGITIPENKREQFILDNLYDAGDPNYPGMSKVDIKMAQMTEEEVTLMRYFIGEGLDLNKIVDQRVQTKKVSSFFKKTTQVNPMTGGKSASTSEDRLESPGR